MHGPATGALSCQDYFLALATAEKIICNTDWYTVVDFIGIFLQITGHCRLLTNTD